MGAGNIFLGLRYNLYKNKLFNYLRCSIGDSGHIYYEINYMPDYFTLFDYSYKRKFNNDDLPIKFYNNQVKYYPDVLIKNELHQNYANDKHYFQITKLQSEKRNKFTFGIYFNNLDSGIKYGNKYMIDKYDSFRINAKFDKNNYKVKFKTKLKVNKKITSEVSKLNLYYY